MNNQNYWHSVRLEKSLCKGCTNCLKQCPTAAIRVQKGKAKILKERCIDCGECIRVCPYHAKAAVTDSFDELKKYKYTIALVAPAFFGQFSKTEDCDLILTALLGIGFDDVFEVARGAEAITFETRKLLASGELIKPAISSACPAVTRLIAVRFPNLIPNIIPLRSPMELSAEAARLEAVQKSGLCPDDIGIFFISPCAAKATAVRDEIMVKHSNVNGVISFRDTCREIAKKINGIKDIKPLSSAGSLGIMWASSGGEASGTNAPRCVAVDGIHNVIELLEDIEDDRLCDIDYVEALACPGGCVGGPLATENSFVAGARLKRICSDKKGTAEPIPDTLSRMWDCGPVYRPVMKLNEDLGKAMQMAIEIDEIEKCLPGLDCGSCGSPSCRTLAEDIVRGYAVQDDCIFKLREKYEHLIVEKIHSPNKEDLS